MQDSTSGAGGGDVTAAVREGVLQLGNSAFECGQVDFGSSPSSLKRARPDFFPTILVNVVRFEILINVPWLVFSKVNDRYREVEFPE